MQNQARHFFIAVAGITLSVINMRAARAQNTPPPVSASITKRQEQLAAFSALRQSLAETETKEPQKAIAAYKKFWEDSDLDPAVGCRVCARIARLYADNARDTKNALAVCDFGLTQYAKSRDRIVLVSEKAAFLNDAKRTDEATALIDANWSLMLLSDTYSTGQLLQTYRAALNQQLKAAAFPTKVIGTFRRLPVYLGDESWGAGVVLYPAVIDDFTQRRQFDDALAWAKLSLMLCPFNQTAITRDANRLLDVDRARITPTGNAPVPAKPSDKTAPAPAPSAPRVFGQAAPEGSKSEVVALPAALTPARIVALRSVALPIEAIDRTAIAARLSATDPRKTEQDRIERITLHLVMGAYRAAMDEALRYETDLPKSANGSLQVARVFKAVDLDLARANDYLAFKKTGKGKNPVPAFLRDFPAETGS